MRVGATYRNSDSRFHFPGGTGPIGSGLGTAPDGHFVFFRRAGTPSHAGHGTLTGPLGRSGFTLLEMLVVMGVIIAIAAMAAPNIVSRMREHTVAQAAESVRDIVARSRTYAIDSGIDYQFRYETDGRNFVVLPTVMEPATSNSLDSDSGESNYLRLTGELDEGFRIKAPEDADPIAESLEAAWFGGLENGLQLSQMTWSSPITFHFDGSSGGGSFRVATDAGLTADLSVRGLTGAISVSTVYKGGN